MRHLYQDIPYTRSEREDKNYTVAQAVSSARQRMSLEARQRRSKAPRGICVNALRGRPYSEKITLKELNQLAQALVDDSYYYDQ